MLDSIFTPEVVEELAELNLARIRDSFYLYRRYIRPDMVWGWWPRELCLHLQKFYEDFAAGKRPKLAIMAPPQFGKSMAVEDFVSWIAGLACASEKPNLKIIYASFSDDLGVRANLNLQRTFKSDLYQQLFPRTHIDERGWKCDTSLIEFVGTTGSFRNTTVNGQINGLGLHLGIVDDPIKGRNEASSKVTRDKTWNWLTDDFLSRFDAVGALLMIMTRWHVDDPLGRLIERYPGVKVLRYPAIAEKTTRTRKLGESLFPEWKPVDFLLERKGVLSQSGWESLYQQNPIVVGGGIFPIEKFSVIPVMDRSKIASSVRYWDKAGTDNGGAFTAGVLMHRMHDGTYLVEHVARGQWSALRREEMIAQWTRVDAEKCQNYQVWVEQEPGSGGKESAEGTVRMLAGYLAFTDKVTGSKEVRAEPYAAQVQGGNVRMVAGEWVADFLDEHETFPSGKYKDQVDATAGAFAKLVTATSYDTSYAGWQ